MASLTTILYISLCILALLIAITALAVKLFIPGPPGPVGHRGPDGPTGPSSTESVGGPTGPLGATGPIGNNGGIGLIPNGGCTALGFNSQTLGETGGSVNGITFYFNHTTDLILTIPATNVSIGDIFTIYNMAPKKNVTLKLSGFQNEATYGDNAFVLEAGKQPTVVLIFITPGESATDKNINLMYSVVSSNNITLGQVQN